jgi:hypothetical protein
MRKTKGAALSSAAPFVLRSNGWLAGGVALTHPIGLLL